MTTQIAVLCWPGEAHLPAASKQERSFAHDQTHVEQKEPA